MKVDANWEGLQEPQGWNGKKKEVNIEHVGGRGGKYTKV